MSAQRLPATQMLASAMLGEGWFLEVILVDRSGEHDPPDMQPEYWLARPPGIRLFEIKSEHAIALWTMRLGQ